MESAGFSQSKAERVEAINLKFFSLQPLMPGLLQKPVPSVFSGVEASVDTHHNNPVIFLGTCMPIS